MLFDLAKTHKNLDKLFLLFADNSIRFVYWAQNLIKHYCGLDSQENIDLFRQISSHNSHKMTPKEKDIIANVVCTST